MYPTTLHEQIMHALTDPASVPMSLAQIVTEEVKEFRGSEQYTQMVQAEQYYRNRSAVQHKTVELAKRSNTKIEHPILKKLVDQKSNYLLSKPFSVVTENEAYGKEIGRAHV